MTTPPTLTPQNATPPQRSPLLQPGEPLLATPFENEKIYTLTKAFQHSAKMNAQKVCFRYRHPLREHKEKNPIDGKEIITIEYEKKVNQLTYEQVDQWMEQLAWGLKALDEECIKSSSRASSSGRFSTSTTPENTRPNSHLFKSNNIGIYLETSKEWIMLAQAAMRHSLSVVTCYANLGIDALVHVINQTNMRCIIVERSFVPTMRQVQSRCKSLEMLIIVDREKKSRGNENGLDSRVEGCSTLKGITFYNLRQKGKYYLNKIKRKGETLQIPNGNTTSVIMYTSGSTGNPKGVVVPHKALLASAAGMLRAIQAVGDDVYLGYLPLAHILELAAEHACLFAGATISYGNPRTLIAKPGGAKYVGDIELFSPTILAGVPRVFDTIHKGIMAKMGDSTLKQWLFQRGYDSMLHAMKGGSYPTFHWNMILFNKMKAALGGRVRVIVSGGAPLSAKTHEFLKVAFGCDVIQGYGLTETCGGGTIQPLGQYRTKNIGHPIASCEIKLVDVPDMGYTSKDKPNPRGEIVIRGHNITNGYYKMPEKTREVFVDDWFYTGDIGMIHKDGTISIIDRKKNLIKLSNGEYVALEALESIYGNSRFVLPNGICVYGNSEESYIVALVLLNPQFVKQWAKENGLGGQSLSSLEDNDKLRKAVLNSFADIAKKNNKKNFERIRDVKLLAEEWTVENGMLTNSMKLKRQDIIKRYQKNIDKMYGAGGPPKIKSKL